MRTIEVIQSVLAVVTQVDSSVQTIVTSSTKMVVHSIATAEATFLDVQPSPARLLLPFASLSLGWTGTFLIWFIFVLISNKVCRENRCQSCACKLPLQVLNDTQLETKPGFLFFNRGLLLSELNETIQDSTPPKPNGSCRANDMTEISKCLANVEKSAKIHQRRREDMASINPIVRPDVKELSGVCKDYNDALSCIDKQTLKVSFTRRRRKE